MTRLCRTCRGDGGWVGIVDDEQGWIDCRTCNGDGFIERRGLSSSPGAAPLSEPEPFDVRYEREMHRNEDYIKDQERLHASFREHDKR